MGGWALETEKERGYELDSTERQEFMANRRVNLCGWCSLTDVGIDINTEARLQEVLAEAGAQTT